MGVAARKRLSPQMEKCCLLLSANVSYAHAARDVEVLTGVKVSHSTQQRLVHRYNFTEPQARTRVETLSVDGGKVRLRTPQGQPSEWRDYKAITLHEQVCAAFFQENERLVAWVNRQPLCNLVTCLGDGHDGVWNLIGGMATLQRRREILDWYHLVENLYKTVGGSVQRLHQVKTDLWHGRIDAAIAAFTDWSPPQVQNFLAYLRKHCQRLPNYQSYQKQGICIGSGAVESTVKRIGLRLKVSGAQWNKKNVSQVLKQRCAYLNLAIV